MSARVCPDCLYRPAHDQRSAAQNGRCVECIGGIAARAAHKVAEKRRILAERLAIRGQIAGRQPTNDCLV